jgi:hypothetical protein
MDLQQTIKPETPQNATEDNPQSDRKIQVHRVRKIPNNGGNGELAIEVEMEARANGRPICSGCGQPAPGYDRLAERRFEYVPLWGIADFHDSTLFLE